MILVSLPIMSEFSPLYPVRYSLALVDLISIIGFTLSEVLAIANSKDTQSHARWMISTVFWVLSPGTVRFSLILFGAIFQPKEFLISHLNDRSIYLESGFNNADHTFSDD